MWPAATSESVVEDCRSRVEWWPVETRNTGLGVEYHLAQALEYSRTQKIKPAVRHFSMSIALPFWLEIAIRCDPVIPREM